MRRYYIKRWADETSLTSMEDSGYELSDDGNTERQILGSLQHDAILTLLTNRQRSVVKKLDDGLTRKEIAKDLQVCLQAVHQIVIRIRKRLRMRGVV